ncbi:MAG: family 20 glycosylhydrolase [bacterium]
MQFIGWMFDIAREQSPPEDFLQEVVRRSARAGYGAVGLYLEHRFAYPSAPWAAAEGCLTPEGIGRLSAAAREEGIRIIPFLNTLGHMEGFIRSEGGQWLAEGPRRGVLQMCPSRPECVEFASNLVADAMDVFEDEWVHLGGDEAYQLGECPLCAERAEKIGKEGLYAEFFERLCRQVIERGKRPCLWGDMLAKHPAALDRLPRETVIFDWHYEGPPEGTSEDFMKRGFEVVLCPAVRTYDSNWCFLDETRRVIDAHAGETQRLGAAGMMVCAWEYFGFSSFASALPLVLAAGRRIASGEGWADAIEAEGGPEYARAAEILGSLIPGMSENLAPGSWRFLRDRLALRGDPFALWREWRGDACGEAGDGILEALGEAEGLLDPENPLYFSVEFHRACVRWVRLVERAAGEYASGDTSEVAVLIEEGREVFERLRPELEKIAREGGSAADVPRLDRILETVDRVCDRIRSQAREGGRRHAFDSLTHPGYIAGDQAGWETESPASEGPI